MSTREIERAAYMAAYRILTADTSSPQLACASARRTRAIDTIAGIIRDTFEVHGGVADAAARNDRAGEPRAAAAAMGRGSRVLVELKQRPSARREETLASIADGTV